MTKESNHPDPQIHDDETNINVETLMSGVTQRYTFSKVLGIAMPNGMIQQRESYSPPLEDIPDSIIEVVEK